MDIFDFRDYCLSLPFVEESTPFDETTLVYKVGGKMFAYTNMESFEWVALKCDPDMALELREQYPDDIVPAYHGNKRHWNGVMTQGDLSEEFIRKQIYNSYRLVIEKNVTPKALKQTILETLDKL